VFRSLLLVATILCGTVCADIAAAQPMPPPSGPSRPGPAGPPGDFRTEDHGLRGPERDRAPPSGGNYYYNGRWIGQDDWRQRQPERDRWARTYHRRHKDADSSALIAGIIGFALGAAIVGSLEDADRARSADTTFDDACARRYRTYDRASRTYLGNDGLRHYCR